MRPLVRCSHHHMVALTTIPNLHRSNVELLLAGVRGGASHERVEGMVSGSSVCALANVPFLDRLSVKMKLHVAFESNQSNHCSQSIIVRAFLASKYKQLPIYSRAYSCRKVGICSKVYDGSEESTKNDEKMEI